MEIGWLGWNSQDDPPMLLKTTKPLGAIGLNGGKTHGCGVRSPETRMPGGIDSLDRIEELREMKEKRRREAGSQLMLCELQSN